MLFRSPAIGMNVTFAAFGDSDNNVTALLVAVSGGVSGWVEVDAIDQGNETHPGTGTSDAFTPTVLTLTQVELIITPPIFIPPGYPDVTLWTDDEIKAVLMVATRWMVWKWRERWAGRRTSIVQALDWPRFGVVLDKNQGVDFWWPGVGSYGMQGFIVLSNIVPPQVKQACCEIGMRSHAKELTPDLVPGAAQLTRQSVVGAIDQSWSDNRDPGPIYVKVNQMLGPFLETASNVIYLERG